MKKRVFITGIAGFIGFHTASFLRQRGNDVTGIDNFNSYYDPILKRARVANLEKQGVAIREIDLLEKAKLEQAIEAFQPTHILHFAAQAGVRYSIQNPKAYLDSNLEGFLNILEICKKRPLIPLVYASSSSVYGLNKKVPFSIGDTTDKQASLYGVTKKSNELMAQTYHHLYGIPMTGLRFFTVYGPWGRPDMAYFSFAKSIMDGLPIEIYNHGKMKRDFTYIDDIVAGIAAALDKGASCNLYNLGNHRPEELLNLVELLEKGLGRKTEKIFLPMQPGDVVSTYADISESENDLGFAPKVTLEEGISHFVRWFKSYYESVI